MGFENFAEGGCPFLEGAAWERGGQFLEERRGARVIRDKLFILIHDCFLTHNILLQQ